MNVLLLAMLLQQGPLDPDLAALVSQVPEPRSGAPSVFNVISSNRLFAGDQLNVLTAAWLPRSLRLRLRQAPSLTPPVLTGVWATPRAPVSGVVATREGDLESYDLFVVAQTVYPLNPGVLSIPPARLTWIEPPRSRSSEERHASASSAPLSVQVRPLPTTGQPPQFNGPVGRDVRIEYRLAGSGRAGSVVPVEVAVSGTGSLPLWPVPTVTWPQGARAYDQGSDASFGSQGVRLGGTRVFRFAIVPDSAGGLSLSPLEYPYFDPSSSSYKVARTPGTIVPILEPAPIAARQHPVPLLEPEAAPMASRFAALPGYVQWGLLLVPLLGIGGLLLWRSLPRRVAPQEPAPARDRLQQLVRAVLPPGTGPSPGAIVAALRHAGIPAADAERLARLHLGLETLRFSGKKSDGDPERRRLDEEIESQLGTVPHPIRRLAGLATLVLGAVLLPGRTSAQDATTLYNRAEYGAAAEAFRGEAREFPSPERWYNVAAADYMAGRDAEAAAALLSVRSEMPRDARVRALWNALAREHGELRRVGRLSLLTSDEVFILSIVAAWLALGLFLFRRRWPLVWIGALGVALVGVLIAGALGHEERLERAVLAGGVSQRVSPHGLAPTIGSIPAFTVVRLLRQNGAWRLISSDNGEGWVPADIVVPVVNF